MRSFKLVLIVHIFILLILLQGCSDDGNPVADNTSEPRIEGNSYYNPDLNFQLSAPGGWKLSKDVEAGGYQLLLFGEMEGSSFYRSNFNIVSEHIGSKTNMSGFLPIAKETIKSMFDEVEFYSERIINIGGIECGELVCQLNQNDVLLSQRQIYFWSNQSIVVITFSSLSTHYIQLSDDFDSIQNSLRIIR